MEKKYYDIIVAIIEKNEKYAGCEEILDDIVQDVYEHSKVVLGSVSNEDVISAYLNKVVATSIITVPKKLNFNTRNKQKVIKQVQEITGINVAPAIVEEPATETISEEDLDFGIEENNQTELSFEEFTPIEENEVSEELEINDKPECEDTVLMEEPLETESLIEEMTAEPIIETTPLLTETIEEEEEEVLEILDNFIEEEQAPIIVEEVSEPEIDKTLVDKMINGVIEDNKEDEEIILSENEALDLELPLEEMEENNTIEVLDKTITNIEEPQEELSLIADDDEELLLEEEEPTLLAEETEVIEEPASAEIELPCYDCFNYEPETPDFAEEEICSDLQEYNSKHPDRKIIEICNLKYKENLSITQIAEKLDFSEDNVLEILNDVIELVKD